MADPNKILVSWPSSDSPLPSEPGPAEYPGDERPACKPFICSNDLLDADGRVRDEAAAAELRRRSAACGYVYFNELLPPAQVLEVRRAFVQILDDAGWLDAGRDDPLSTRAKQTPLGTKLEGQDEYRPIMRAFQSLQSFHALSKSPRLLGVLDALFDEDTFVHPRNIGRIILPQKNDFKTMPHQCVSNYRALTLSPPMPTCGRCCRQGLGPHPGLPKYHHRLAAARGRVRRRRRAGCPGGLEPVRRAAPLEQGSAGPRRRRGRHRRHVQAARGARLRLEDGRVQGG